MHRCLFHACIAVLSLLALCGCRTLPTAEAGARAPATALSPAPDDWHAHAVAAAQRAQRQSGERAAPHWLRCAQYAYRAGATGQVPADDIRALANHCNDAWLAQALAASPAWATGPATVLRGTVQVEFRDLSPYFNPPITLVRAAEVSAQLYGGTRHVTEGWGVPLAAISPRCTDQPLCELQPPEGVFRPATAWIEWDGVPVSPPRLVIGNPLRSAHVTVGTQSVALAADTSASYAHGAGTSSLKRLGIWGLLGGDEVGRRAGLYLLEDYDPGKRPIVMLHGLGSSPLAWARLSTAIWADPALRRHFQVWHVVYQTNAPLLVTRRRVQAYLDAAWATLDPEHDDAAREGMVLIGHSMGGVLSRLLCVESGDVLWSAAFSVPPGQLPGDAEDVAVIDTTFRFTPYPGVSRAIFLAAPHLGSPSADRWYGRLMRSLVGRRAPEMQSLRRVARAHPQAVREDVRDTYQQARLNSIATLQTAQPVRRAGEHLMPAAHIPYHTIAGRLPGRVPEGDGVVPLASAVIPGAASTRVVVSGHDVYQSDAAIAEVLRILHEDLAARE
jgi:pimeloyl-ACP methyl ester carboxylesterase